jgi:hypothetical protein
MDAKRREERTQAPTENGLDEARFGERERSSLPAVFPSRLFAFIRGSMAWLRLGVRSAS